MSEVSPTLNEENKLKLLLLILFLLFLTACGEDNKKNAGSVAENAVYTHQIEQVTDEVPYLDESLIPLLTEKELRQYLGQDAKLLEVPNTQDANRHSYVLSILTNNEIFLNDGISDRDFQMLLNEMQEVELGLDIESTKSEAKTGDILMLYLQVSDENGIVDTDINAYSFVLVQIDDILYIEGMLDNGQIIQIPYLKGNVHGIMQMLRDLLSEKLPEGHRVGVGPRVYREFPGYPFIPITPELNLEEF